MASELIGTRYWTAKEEEQESFKASFLAVRFQSRMEIGYSRIMTLSLSLGYRLERKSDVAIKASDELVTPAAS